MAKIELDWLDESASVAKDEFVAVETQDKLTQLAAQYSIALANKLGDVDASSSGDLADSIQPLSIQVKDNIFYVDIVAAKYASFIDEGVDGWAKSRGSRFKFKTRGVDPKGAMVKSVKDYLVRENKISQSKYAVLNKKSKVRDRQIQAATTVAYMIKRMGIKATHFWRDATTEFSSIVEKELGMAVKIDIINNFK
jgi:hypothetical protein